MHNKQFYTNVSYTFDVQSVEDFQRQLIEFAMQQEQFDNDIDVTDLSQAQEMLKGIGVEVN